MRIVILSLLVFLSFLRCGFTQSEEPKEEQDPYFWDFGRVSQRDVLEHTFVLKNDSPVTLHIKSINTSCGCITSRRPKKKEISPGESIDIQVKFDTRDYSGVTKQFVYIHIDQQDRPIIKLTLKADIQKHVQETQAPDLKSEIYSKLKCCPCQVSFDKCTCAEAKEIKAYIDALLESGVSKEDIFYKVAKKFSLKTIQDKQLRQNIEEKLIKDAGKNRPQIFLESTSFDFGRVNKKQGKIAKTFNLSNKGNSVLIIRNLKTTCPCATVSLKVNKKKTPYFGTEGAPLDWQIEIKPQEFGELELMIDLNSQHVKTGKLIREASVFSNDPVYPEVTAKVEADVSN